MRAVPKANVFGKAVPKKTVAAPVAPDPYASVIGLQRGAILTPAQILARSRQTAIANENAALGAQRAQTNVEVGRYNDQQNRAQGFALALGKLMSGDPSTVASNYRDAAGTLSGLGAGLTGNVADLYQGAVDKTREQVAQATGGRGEVTATPVGDLTNAALYSGATLPAGSLADSSVNAMALAREDAARRTGGIADIAANYGAQADQAIAAGGDAARALVAQRPATIQQLVQQLTDNRQAGITNLAGLLNQRATYKQNAAAQAFTEDMQRKQFGLTSRTLDNSLREAAAKRIADQVSQGLDKVSAQRQWEDLYHYKVKDALGTPDLDANGHYKPLPGWKLDANGEVVQRARPGTGKVTGPGGVTATKWASMVSTASDDAASLKEGTKPDQQWVAPQYDADGKVRPGTGGFVPVKDSGTPGASYDEIYRRLLTRNSSPRWRKEVTNIVNGLFLPGEGGRPWGRGDAAKSAIATIVRTAYTSRMARDAALKAMLGQGLPRDLVEKELRRVYGSGPDSFPNKQGYTEPIGPPSPPPKDKPAETYHSETDRIVAPGPPGTGTHKTASGRYVDEYGRYVTLPGG